MNADDSEGKPEVVQRLPRVRRYRDFRYITSAMALTRRDTEVNASRGMRRSKQGENRARTMTDRDAPGNIAAGMFCPHGGATAALIHT